MSMKAGIGLLELSESMGVPAHDELVEALRVAAAVQRYREPDAPVVSRSSLLYAAAVVQPEVANILVESELDRRRWEAAIGVEGFELGHEPSTETPESAEAGERAVEVPPEEMEASVAAYADAFSGGDVGSDGRAGARPLDARGLAFGIVAAAGTGRTPPLEREEECGLRYFPAIVMLGETILHREHAPWNDVERFGQSTRARGVLETARTLTRESLHAPFPVTSSLLLFAFQASGRDEHVRSTAWFVTRFLQERASERASPDVMDEWIRWYADHTPAWLIDSRPLDWIRGGRMAASKGEARPDVLPLVTRPVIDVLRRARRIARRVRGDKIIHARDLLGGLLALASEHRPLGFGDLLEHLGIDGHDMVEAFLGYLDDNVPTEDGDDLDAWRSVFRPEAFIAGMPRFDAEGFEGPDLLGIEGDVHAFANLLAAESLVPPLAVGLFGDWGSGKTFFMQKLRRRIDTLARAADRREAGETAFLSHVVQIEFNAWHYVDTNLWASLVTHIFERLHRHFVPREDEERRRWERLLDKLDEAFDLVTDAEETLAGARADVELAEKERDARRIELSQAARVVWSALKEAPEVAAGMKSHIRRIEDAMGADMAREVRESLLARGEEATELLHRLPLFRQTVVRGIGSLKTFGPAAVVAVLGGLVVALVPLLPGTGDALDQVAGTLAEIVAMIGGAGTWLGAAFRRASRAMDSVEGMEAALHEELERLQGQDVAELRQARSAMEAAEARLAARRERMAELRAEVEDARPAHRLSNFLAERASSSDYRQHLGLAALIRRDFERLHDLMHPQRFTIEAEGAVESLDAEKIPEGLRREIRRHDVPFARAEENGKAGTRPSRRSGEQEPEGSTPPRVEVDERGHRWVIEDPEHSRSIHIERGTRRGRTWEAVGDGKALRCTVQWDLPRIDRIILYIDDLDRCPPERVVEVLQAVHLLLAFPLFVVVVGVDARWVSRSLALRFRSLWRRGELTGGSDGQAVGDPDDTAATPQDYLEKIFQVPFWLEPMTPDATRDFIDGLLVRSLADDHPPDVGAELGDGTDGRSGQGDDTETSRADLPKGRRSTHAGAHPKQDRFQQERPGPKEVAGRPGDGRSHAGDPEIDASDASSGDRGGEVHRSEARDGGGGDAAAAARPEASARAGRGDELDERELNPKSLELDDRERTFMRRLAPLIGRSPRAVKRYVNVYRLIRAGLPESRLEAFLGSERSSRPYRAVLFLLAVVVGAPTLSGAFFRELRDGVVDRTVDDVVGAVRAELDPDDELAARECVVVERCLSTMGPEQRRTIQVPHMVEHLRRVGRYSFRAGRVQ